MELLVVIAIIGILVALLLPAIQAAREAARRAQCQSHLKNLALACLNYESATKHLPPGFIATSPGSTESWSWSIFVLPYIEEQGVFDRLRPSETFMQPVDGTRTGKRNLADLFKAAGGSLTSVELQPLQQIIPVFRCPSDSTPPLCPVANPADPLITRTADTGTWERHFNGLNSPPGFQPPSANYIGVKGIVDAGCPMTGTSPNLIAEPTRCGNTGVFFGSSKVTLRQISDGTSSTFMIGERNKFCLAGTWIGVRNPLDGAEMFSSLWALGHAGDPFGRLNFPTTGNHNTCTEGFSSAHPGGAFFAYVDGSVHWINDDVSYDIGPNPSNPTDCYAIKGNSSVACKPQDTSSPPKTIGIYQRLAWKDDGLSVGGGDY